MLEGYLSKVERGGLFAKLSEGNSLASSKEIGYMVTDAAKWKLDIERDVSEDEAALNVQLLIDEPQLL